jgi:sugar O-acyltransferase (sialic acid O-acetyltransferase NeuD family)
MRLGGLGCSVYWINWSIPPRACLRLMIEPIARRMPITAIARSRMDVLIIGAGGHGKVVLDILRAAGKHRPIGFVDADPSLAGSTVSDLPVLGTINQISRVKSRARGAIVAIGDNRTRWNYAQVLLENGFELVNAIHPSAVVSSAVKVGRNVVIAANATVCTEASLADSVIVNTGAIVDHECEIGESAHVAPGARLAGRVRIGAGAMIGLGASIIQCLNVGEDAIVGAGAVIIRDVPAKATVAGVPGRIIKPA